MVTEAEIAKTLEEGSDSTLVIVISVGGPGLFLIILGVSFGYYKKSKENKKTHELARSVFVWTKRVMVNMDNNANSHGCVLLNRNFHCR